LYARTNNYCLLRTYGELRKSYSLIIRLFSMLFDHVGEIIKIIVNEATKKAGHQIDNRLLLGSAFVIIFYPCL
jgi:hypothetical protein